MPKTDLYAPLSLSLGMILIGWVAWRATRPRKTRRLGQPFDRVLRR